MDLSKEELLITNEALIKAKRLSETEGFKTEKRILDSYRTNPNAETIIQGMYDLLNRKIESAIKEIKNE